MQHTLRSGRAWRLPIRHAFQATDRSPTHAALYCVGSPFTLPTACLHICCRVHDIEAKYYADGEDAYDMRKYLRKRGNRVTAPPPRIEQFTEPKQPTSREQKDGVDGEEKAAGTEGKEAGADKAVEAEEGGREKDKKKKKKKKGQAAKEDKTDTAAVAKEKAEEKPAELVKQDIEAAMAALQLQTKKTKQKG